jgi:hypothetical protein
LAFGFFYCVLLAKTAFTQQQLVACVWRCVLVSAFGLIVDWLWAVFASRTGDVCCFADLFLCSIWVFVFVWVRRFLIFHKTAIVGGCFLGSAFFSLSVSVWDTHFPPHGIHGSMLEAHSCVCGTMYSSPYSSTPKNRTIHILLQSQPTQKH